MTKLGEVECGKCGASTPLPDDLRVAFFRCAFCHRELATVDYAGKAAVSADALLGHMDRVVRDGVDAADAARAAPRFSGDVNVAFRDSACVDCGASLQVPMDIHHNFVTCVPCGRVQAIHLHVPQQERFEADMRRQVAGNEALDRLLREGAACTQCGGKVSFPDDGSVQVVCAYCGTALLLGQYVDPSAVARRRLKHGVFAFRDELMRKQEESQANARFVALVMVVVGIVVAVVATWGAHAP